MTLDYETRKALYIHPILLEFPGEPIAQVDWWHNMATGRPVFFNVLAPQELDITGAMMVIS